MDGQTIQIIQNEFKNSADFVVKEVEVAGTDAFLCFYSTMVDAEVVNRQLRLLEERVDKGTNGWGSSASTSAEAFHKEKFVTAICEGSAVLIFPKSNLMLEIKAIKIPERSPDEPVNEQVVRGMHQGFVENFNSNIGLLRNKMKRPDLVVESFAMERTVSKLNIVYLADQAAPEVVQELRERLSNIPYKEFYSSGQLEDYIEDRILSPFPQFLTTERPDRVTYNLLEGKVAIFTDSSPTTLLGPVNLFTFYESPDDYTSRVLVGSFYRLVRLLAFFLAILLPAFYISVMSFHSEILPVELTTQVKSSVKDIPYPPIFEALLLELFIELIREASIRLPQPIGQTVAIVGGIVIGDAIVSAGLASNQMVIVVAMTAIAGFVVPSPELNMVIRMLRFPFMILASTFGFLGMLIGTLILFVHLLNLSSLKQPYLSPIIPFDPTRFRDVFFRVPYFRPDRQQPFFRLGGKKAK